MTLLKNNTLSILSQMKFGIFLLKSDKLRFLSQKNWVTFLLKNDILLILSLLAKRNGIRSLKGNKAVPALVTTRSGRPGYLQETAWLP